MNENPVSLSPLIEEHPVPDPNLFLLKRTNRAFIERRNDSPVLGGTAFSWKAFNPLIYLLLISFLLSGLCIFPNSGLPLLLLISFIIFAFYTGNRPADNEPPDLAGWIIPGVVTHSEKIRIENSQHLQERLGIRYEFPAPGGVVMEAYAEGDSVNASDRMAPAPGTPVMVWYTDEGTCYLL
jgi:hypothetical protein